MKSNEEDETLTKPRSAPLSLSQKLEDFGESLWPDLIDKANDFRQRKQSASNVPQQNEQMQRLARELASEVQEVQRRKMLTEFQMVITKKDGTQGESCTPFSIQELVETSQKTQFRMREKADAMDHLMDEKATFTRNRLAAELASEVQEVQRRRLLAEMQDKIALERRKERENENLLKSKEAFSKRKAEQRERQQGSALDSSNYRNASSSLSASSDHSTWSRRSTDTPPGDFPMAGVKLSYLLDGFFDDCRLCRAQSNEGSDIETAHHMEGFRNISGWTTTEVCEHIIKPKTAEMQISYCEWLQLRDDQAVAETAEVFISHAHCYLFLDVLSALAYHFRKQPDIVVWFDLFSINQHYPQRQSSAASPVHSTGRRQKQADIWSFEWLSTTFREAIGEIGHLVMVMSPWNNPVPFTRAWCIFECYCSAITEGNFEIAMSDKDRNRFLEDIRIHPKVHIDQMLSQIRSRASHCSVPEDKRKILKGALLIEWLKKIIAFGFRVPMNTTL